MSDYIKCVDIKNKKIYSLGKRSSAITSLPILMSQLPETELCIFGDETHSFLEEKYESTKYSGQFIETNFDTNKTILDFEGFKTYNEEKYDYFFEEYGGEILTTKNILSLISDK